MLWRIDQNVVNFMRENGKINWVWSSWVERITPQLFANNLKFATQILNKQLNYNRKPKCTLIVHFPISFLQAGIYLVIDLLSCLLFSLLLHRIRFLVNQKRNTKLWEIGMMTPERRKRVVANVFKLWWEKFATGSVGIVEGQETSSSS